MKIKVITACLINKKHRKVDEILEIDDRLARELITMERVVPYRELPQSSAPVQTKQTKQGK